MTDEMRKDFTRRLSNTNRSGMVVIIYDIFFENIDEARSYLAKGEKDAFKESLRKADAVLVDLRDSLNFDYELSYTLFSLYKYARERLVVSLIKRDPSGMDEACAVMEKLYSAFCKVAEADDSAPIMQNTESVTVGMTYGRGTLTESCDTGANRGFLA